MKFRPGLFKGNLILRMRHLNRLFAAIVWLLSSDCSKLVTVGAPDTALTSQNIYTDDQTAASVLTGIYTKLSVNSPLFAQGMTSLSVVAGLSADELILFGGSVNANAVLVPFFLNSLASGGQGSTAPSIWSNGYSNLYTLNIAIENLKNSEGLTPAVRQQLIGEAKFMRAFYYFYLTNLFGNIPLTITSNYTVNEKLTCSPQSLVYQQIIADLKDAQSLLCDGYVGSDAMTPSQIRSRPDKWTATALLARTYVYIRSYDSAETQATALINNNSLYSLCQNMNNVFMANSTESIWQLQPVNAGWNTEDARFFILPPTGPTDNVTIGYPVYLTTQILDAFETGDQRRQNWVDSVITNSVAYYYPYKYKSATFGNPVTEYLTVFRLAEQYLIRAEARAMQNNIGGAQTDVNMIRNRAGLQNTTAIDQNSLMNAILHERQVELFTEWGHRWLDLKRTGDIDSVMNAYAPSKGATWNSNWQLYPIPLYDMLQDPNLIQNPGY